MNEIERATVYLQLIKENTRFTNEPKMLDIAINALEKEMPKKIYHRKWVGIDGVPYDLCPNCKTNLCTNGFMPSKKEKYCANCGQKLDWSNGDNE